MPRGWLLSGFYCVAPEALTRSTISSCRRRSKKLALVCDIAANSFGTGTDHSVPTTNSFVRRLRTVGAVSESVE
jgi:hypothetical protein